jgi:hypothetical protein
MDLQSQLQEQRQESQLQEERHTESLKKLRLSFEKKLRTETRKSEEITREGTRARSAWIWMALVAFLCLTTYQLYRRYRPFAAEQGQDHTNGELIPLRGGALPLLPVNGSNIADDYAVPDAPAYTLHDFASSNFKREYEWTATKPLAPAQNGRLLEAVRIVIEGYCTRNNIDQARGDNFFLELRREWQLTDEISIAAERLWTSEAVLVTAGNDRNIEFCFIFSQLLREDPASLARPCAIIARALNTNLVAGRTGEVHFPPNGECWRGGGFDEQHRGFFEVGKKYRVPGFLATATVKNVTNTFMHRAEAMGYPVVQWCIRLDQRSDPQGGNSMNHRCKHVNLLRVTHCPGEEEYLFAAFSVFTVRGVVWSASRPSTMQDPHRITLEAAIDNSLEAEDLPLAPWS